MKRSTKTIIACALFFPAFSFASHDGLKEILLDDAISIALENSTEVLVARKKYEQADSQYRAAWGSLLPQVDSEVSASRQSYEGGLNSLSDGQYDVRFLQMKMSVNPASFYYFVGASRANLESAREEQARVNSRVSYSVCEAFFEICRANEIVKLRKTSVSSLRVNLADTQNMYKTGSVSKYDLLQSEARLKSMEPLLSDAESSYLLALDNFNYVLGMDSNVYNADCASVVNDARAITSLPEDSVIDRLIAVATRNRSEIKSAQTALLSARDASAAYLAYSKCPTFSISSSYGVTKNIENTDAASSPLVSNFSSGSGWEKNWQVRAALSYRWSSWLPGESTREKGVEYEGKSGELAAALKDVRRKIAISVSREFRKLKCASLNIGSNKKALASAEEGFRIATESYRAGVMKNSDLLTAEVNFTEAKNAYIQSLFDYHTSIRALKYETGADVSEIIFEVVK